MSYGQELLKKFLDTYGLKDYLENYRPEWLYGMELDFYFEKRKLAIEFNGDQHYTNTSYGSPDEQIKRDVLKASICGRRKIRLVVVHARDLVYRGLAGRLKVSRETRRKKEAELLKIQEEVWAYRKLLRTKYGDASPTTMNDVDKRRLIMAESRKKKQEFRKAIQRRSAGVKNG